ncbi:MAG TPA: hypothetical protein VGK86_02720 [Thermoanaerobaculia bacterium]
MKRFPVFAVLAGAVLSLLLLPTCRSTKHTVARIVAPAARPTEPYIPPEPTVPAATPRGIAPSPTPTVVGMPVVTAPPASRYERSPGVLYEELVPTAAAATPVATPRSTRTPRPTATPTRAVSQKPGTYYEDEQGRPIPTATPTFR